MSSHQEIILCELPMPALDIGDAAPYSVTTGNAHLSYGRIRARRLGRLRACVQHGYFGSRRPTIAAIIAIPMRKSCISIAGAIDRVPYARVHYRWVVERTFAWQYGRGGWRLASKAARNPGRVRRRLPRPLQLLQLPRRGSGRGIACKALPPLRIPCEPREMPQPLPAARAFQSSGRLPKNHP